MSTRYTSKNKNNHISFFYMLATFRIYIQIKATNKLGSGTPRAPHKCIYMSLRSACKMSLYTPHPQPNHTSKYKKISTSHKYLHANKNCNRATLFCNVIKKRHHFCNDFSFMYEICVAPAKMYITTIYIK